MTAPYPTACVVIPTLRRARFLEETLRHLVGTDYPRDRLEIFIVDGGADEETRVVVEACRGRTDIPILFHAEAGLRNSPSRNFAIRNTAAEVIVFLDDDCITRPGWLRALIDPLARGEADISGGTDRAPDDDPFLAHCEDVAFSSLIGSGGVRSASAKAPLKFCPLTCNMAMRRDKVLELGGFDETIRVAEDTDFAYKARVRGFRVVLVPEAEVRHRRRAFVKAICFHNYIRGYARLWLHRRYPQHSEAAFFAPAAGLAAGLLLLALGFFYPPAWRLLAAGAALYALLLVIVGIQGVRAVRRPAALVVVPFLVALHHFWYAIGTLHAPLTGYRKVYVTYSVNVSDPFGRPRKTS
jgi:succinoglycan biosynthesis protein ExoA